MDSGLGSTTGLTADASAATDSYTYDVFGATRSHTGGSSQAFKFTGELEDGDVASDLYYLRARYYDPLIGRFWSQDPLLGSVTQPQMWNHYPYVLNNAVNLVDPYGLFPCPGCGKIKGIVKPVVRQASRAVAIIDTLPLWGPAGLAVDFLAAGLTQADIFLSSCTREQKIGLSTLNAINLGVGVGTFGLGRALGPSYTALQRAGLSFAVAGPIEGAITGVTIAQSLEECETARHSGFRRGNRADKE